MLCFQVEKIRPSSFHVKFIKVGPFRHVLVCIELRQLSLRIADVDILSTHELKRR